LSTVILCTAKLHHTCTKRSVSLQLSNNNLKLDGLQSVWRHTVHLYRLEEGVSDAVSHFALASWLCETSPGTVSECRKFW